MRAAIVLGVLALAAPARAEMVCEGGPLPPQTLDGQIRAAGSGGVIIAANELPDWRFRDINRLLRPHVEVVAPGLAIYHPPPVADPELALEDATQVVRARLPRALVAERPLDPPALKRVVFIHEPRAERTMVLAEVTGKVPEGAIGVVVSRVVGAERVAMAWNTVRTGAADFALWHSPTVCQPRVASLIMPTVGETVEIRWLDASGRLSEPSRTLTVARAPAK